MGGGASTPRAADPASGSSPSDRSLTDASVEALITLIAAATLEATPPLGAAAAIEDMVAQAWTRTADRELRGAQAARIACELARAAAARGVVGSGEDAASGGASMNEAQLRALLAGTLASATRADERDELAELVEQLPGAAPAAEQPSPPMMCGVGVGIGTGDSTRADVVRQSRRRGDGAQSVARSAQLAAVSDGAARVAARTSRLLGRGATTAEHEEFGDLRSIHDMPS